MLAELDIQPFGISVCEESDRIIVTCTTPLRQAIPFLVVVVVAVVLVLVVAVVVVWRFGSVGNVVGRINEVNQRRARLVLGWVTVCRWVNHLGV